VRCKVIFVLSGSLLFIETQRTNCSFDLRIRNDVVRLSNAAQNCSISDKVILLFCSLYTVERHRGK